MKKRVLSDESITPESIEPKVDVPEVVKPEVIEPKQPVEVKFPEGIRTGKYNAVKVGAEYAVYSPDGARVSGLLPLDKAKDIVREQNQAAHL